MIKLSVAIVTRNRPTSLDRTLESLRKQSVQPFEIVVSDDSDDEFVTQVQQVAETWGCRYTKGPRQGLYANRNYAALACRGTHIRTMDDDHLFPAGHFEQCLDAVKSDPDSIWTTGELGFLNGELCWDCPTAGQLSPAGVGGPVADLDDNWAIADGSTIYPAKVFAQGHRMVEDFNYGSSYLEFGAYLYKLGFVSRCIPDCYIEHYPENESILTRVRTPAVVESSLFSSFCYSLYFKKNPFALARWVAPKAVLLFGTKGYRRSLRDCWMKARSRWSLTLAVEH